jgi:hypothetical protein
MLAHNQYSLRQTNLQESLVMQLPSLYRSGFRLPSAAEIS